MKPLPSEPTQEMIDRMTAAIDCVDVPTSDDPPDRDYDYEMRKAYRALYAVLQPAAPSRQFEQVIAGLSYDGDDINSLTVGEIRRALPCIQG